MALPTSQQLVDQDRVSICPYFTGTRPIPYTIDSDNIAAASATSLTLSLTTVDGVAATATDFLELEDDSEFFIASSNTVAVSGAVTAIANGGERVVKVDDAAGGVPSELVQEGDYISYASHSQLYLVVSRGTDVDGYNLRLDPGLQQSVADDEAVTVYNVARLDLGVDDQFVRLTSTAQAVGVKNVKYPIAAATTSQEVFPMRQLLGITDITPSPTVNSTTITDMKTSSNFGASVTLDVAVTAFEFPKNSGLMEVVLPSLDPGENFNPLGVFYIYLTKDGKRIQDTGDFTAAEAAGPVGAGRTYGVTIGSSRGASYQRWQP